MAQFTLKDLLYLTKDSFRIFINGLYSCYCENKIAADLLSPKVLGAQVKRIGTYTDDGVINVYIQLNFTEDDNDKT